MVTYSTHQDPLWNTFCVAFVCTWGLIHHSAWFLSTKGWDKRINRFSALCWLHKTWKQMHNPWHTLICDCYSLLKIYILLNSSHGTWNPVTHSLPWAVSVHIWHTLTKDCPTCSPTASHDPHTSASLYNSKKEFTWYKRRVVMQNYINCIKSWPNSKHSCPV